MPRTTLTRVLTSTQTARPTTLFPSPTPSKTQKVRAITFFTLSASANSRKGHAFGSGYRTNGSSSSSLGPPRYGINSDGMYHSSFPDASYPPSNGNPYDIGSLPSSYSNGGKVSPLTPTDPGGLHHPSPFSSKDYPPNYSELGPDRRMSSGSYPNDFDDYTPFATSNTLPHFPGPDRLPPRFSPENRFSQPGHPSHGSDIMRSVAPNATHLGYRHDEMPQYMPNNPVDQALAEMRLQPHPMGSSSDLHTFIRYVFDLQIPLLFSSDLSARPYLEQYVRTPNRLAFGERTVIVMSSKVAQKSYGTEKRSV